MPFFQSNDRGVAARLAVPASLFALDYARPDFVLLRVLARGLVMWDEVEPTAVWVEAQLPEFIARWASDHSIGPRVAESADGGGNGVVYDSEDDMEVESVGQTHAAVLAGACLALGLRYAGTACAPAAATITRYLEYFARRKAATPAQQAGAPPPLGADRAALESCVGVCALALGVVMAGTGDLGALRVLRRLRRRLDAPSLTYGDHCAASMAIGFLFLGGGRMTFGRSNEAIAALLIALYPRMPATPSDNRCHLQALRHLYVLAAQPRGVETRDVDTGEAVYAPVEVELRSGGRLQRVAPCLLPDLALVRAVRVLGPRHWPQECTLNADTLLPPHGHPLRGGVVYVKVCSHVNVD